MIDHDSISDGATIFNGNVFEDPIDGIAADPRFMIQTERSKLPGKIKARIDIVDLIAQDIEIKQAGKDWHACCPFHSEKTPSFTISRAKQFAHCFGCGWHGDAFNWMMAYHGMSFHQALQALGNQCGVSVPRFFKGADAKESGLSPRKLVEVEEALSHELLVIMQYLDARARWRSLSPQARIRIGQPEEPPKMAERELKAATRIKTAIEVLYQHHESNQ